ncbi:MAG TPA: site-specific DNA-methyltransferase [Candidatus Cryptobacteroides excrementigallinarum]|nr:site-specific DNA-methyltransferase [Candidatus Cryptobacteroides excrementigallinarum]
MNRNELANKIRGIDGLTNDEKSALIELLRKQKKYGLVWEDKPEDVEERLREELPVLIEDTGKAIVSEDAGAPNHILIEGDNLEALTALAYTHEGQIDVIYIDPPYNTGNKDFVYNDQFVDKEDSYRHSKWLSFMSKRLRIAKRLLSDKGVIFISIDDNEQAQLKLLCDEVFGEKNFIGCIPRLTSPQRFAQEKNINISHDSLLIYSQNNNVSLNKIILDNKNGKTLKEDKIGHYYKGDTKALIAPISQGYSENCDYDFEYKGKIYKPINKDGIRNRWFWTKKRMEAAAKLGILRETKSGLRMQIYQDVKFDENTNTLITKEIGVRFCSLDLLDNKYSNPNGVADLSVLGDIKFNNPKPISLIRTICELYPAKNSTILDFFAGSGTTLHAAMQLNAEDGGHRKCILVTNNENNICEEVTYERNKRVIQGYTTPKGEEVPGLTGNTLRYYRTDFISRDRSPRNMRALVAASTDLLCIKNDIYKEARLAGRNINPKIARYFAEGGRSMLVIYDERAISAIVKILETVEPGKEKIKVYVFSAGSYAYDDEFEEVADKVELCALPDAIYQAYQKVLPKRRPKFLPEAMEEKERSNSPENGMLNFTDEEAEA